MVPSQTVVERHWESSPEPSGWTNHCQTVSFYGLTRVFAEHDVNRLIAPHCMLLMITREHVHMHDASSVAILKCHELSHSTEIFLPARPNKGLRHVRNTSRKRRVGGGFGKDFRVLRVRLCLSVRWQDGDARNCRIQQKIHVELLRSRKNNKYLKSAPVSLFTINPRLRSTHQRSERMFCPPPLPLLPMPSFLVRSDTRSFRMTLNTSTTCSWIGHDFFHSALLTVLPRDHARQLDDFFSHV